MPCSAKFSLTLQTVILSIETSDFLKHKIFLSQLIQQARMQTLKKGFCSGGANVKKILILGPKLGM